MKNGLMIVSFVGEQNSPYYKSEIFLNILKTTAEQTDRYVLRPKGTRLAMTIRRVESIEAGYKLLSTL